MSIIPQKLPKSKPINIPKKGKTEFKEEYCEDRNFPDNPNPNSPFKTNDFFNRLHNLEIHTGSFRRYKLPEYIQSPQSISSL